MTHETSKPIPPDRTSRQKCGGDERAHCQIAPILASGEFPWTGYYRSPVFACYLQARPRLLQLFPPPHGEREHPPLRSARSFYRTRRLCPRSRKPEPVMAAYQYIHVMKGLGKTYPGGREVLKEIYLSFLPGAKIGVLGVNGSGKSSLLRIMAGLDKDFVGEAWSAEGATVGYLAQEPPLDPAKDVAGNVMEGMAATKALLDRFEAVSARFAEELSEDEMNDLIN